MTTLLRSRWLAVAVMTTTIVGCSSLRFGNKKCTTCDQGAVYPPAGSYDLMQPVPGNPPSLPAPVPVPSATDPVMPPAPPPPLGARMPATLQGIRYSTTDFFHNANNNVRAMFTR
jgi:hypothetical protein